MAPLPMFPLGTVLLPGAALPLHVFEPRYRQLTRDCLSGAREFGVVLIERGSEVGGGDVRTDAGTVARIVEATELPDGRWVLGCIGVRRVRVTEWLPDEPYPRAHVEDWPDEPADDDAIERSEHVVALLRRALALQAELDIDAPPLGVALADDPVLAVYQAASLAPLGPLDRQKLLTAASPGERVEQLENMLTDVLQVLEHRLANG